MKKKFIIPALLVSILALGGLASCDNNQSDDTLNIVVIDADYGHDWINTMRDDYIAAHPDTKIKVTALYESESLIQQHLASSKNNDDLYISVGATWKSYAATNSFASLDDLLEETVDNVKVKDKVSDEFKDSIYFTKSDGSKHCYRLPFTSGLGGIFYNTKMFEQNGWQIPTTFDELLELCKTIKNAKIARPGDLDGTTAVSPFIYTGRNTDYFDYLVFDWWAQIAGKENIQDFLKYDSADNFDVTKSETYNALKTATKRWKEIFGPDAGYCVDGYNNKDAGDAQKDFVNGYAAMMVNGDWLYNASLNYTGFEDTFELGIMKTPVLSEAKAEYADTSYIIGEDQYIAIPATSKKQDLAKDFIKYMISDEGCKTFVKKAHGFLAYDADYSSIEITDKFLLSEIQLRNSYTSKFTNFSSDHKYLCNNIDIWGTSANRPFLSVLNGAQANLDTSFVNIYSTVSARWQDWTDKSK